MTQSYDDLMSVLEKEFQLCTKLMELLQREKEIIISLDPTALEQLLREKEEITSSIKVCDETREKVLEVLGFKGRTISEVAALADAVYRERLDSLASKFSLIISNISELNQFNSKLIEKSLYYIKTSSNFLGTFDVSPSPKVSVEA